MQDAPASIEVWESADVVSDSTPGAVLWYHRNEYSVVPLTLKHQGLESLADLVRDPLLNRTFGGRMSGKGFVNEGPGGLKSSAPVTQFALAIATHSAQTESVGRLAAIKLAEIAAKADAATAANAPPRGGTISGTGVGSSSATAMQRPPSHVTQAYILQRWMTACGGRGNYPDQVQRLDLHRRSEVHRRARSSTPTGAAGAIASGGKTRGCPTSR